MKRTILFISFSILILNALIKGSFAYESGFSFKLAPQTFKYTYTEPSIMEIDGNLQGIQGKFIYRKDQDTPHNIILDLIYAKGSGDYNSNKTGSLANSPQEYYDLRGIWGIEVKSEFVNFLPFFGIAGRTLTNDENGKSTTGHNSYKRISTYNYIPIGVRVSDFKLIDSFRPYISAEYDYFLEGVQENYILTNGKPIRNKQKNGYGYRFEIGASKKIGKLDYGLSLFYRAWSIENSEKVIAGTTRKVAIYYGPENETKEIGVALSVMF